MGCEYRADDRVWAGQMTGQHGPVLRFMRHDAQREQLLCPRPGGKKGGEKKSCAYHCSSVRTSYRADACPTITNLHVVWHHGF